MKHIRTLLIAAMTGLLVSCVGPRHLGIENLQGAWRLTGWSDVKRLPSDQITLVIDDTGVHGNSTCNAYSSTLTVDSRTFLVGTIGTTFVLCVGEKADAEATYLRLLSGVTIWSENDKDGSLVLSSGRNELLRFLRL